MTLAEVDTLVIGGGAAGLAVARELEERGLDAQIVETEAAVGVRWRHAYDRLHLHTPRSRSGLPHQPMPASYPQYPARQQVVDYLADYASALKTQPLFGRRAVSVMRADDHWLTRTSIETFRSRHLVVATGAARLPVVPRLVGIEAFGGEVLHTSLYRNGAPYAGRRVLVVGFGNSAAEIAIDLHEYGAFPTLSVRGPVNVLPRDVFGIPVASLSLVQKLLGPRVADRLSAPLMRLILGDLAKLGLARPPYGPTTQIAEQHRIPVLDIGTIDLIRAGKIEVRPGIAAVTTDGAVFADGRREKFDAIVLGTGYRAGLEELLAAIPGVLDDRGGPLVSGGLTAAPALYFCGFAVAAGGQLREIGFEAGRIAGLIATRRARPDVAELRPR